MGCFGYRHLAFGVFAGLTLAGVAHANDAVLPAQSRFTGALVLPDAKYSTDNNADFDATGTLLFGGYKATLNPHFSLGGGVGVLADGRLTGDVKAKSGNGYRLSLDADLEAARFGPSEVIVSIGANQDRFSFKNSGVTYDLLKTDVLLGALFRHHVSQTAALYGGLQVFLVDRGDVKVKNNGVSFDPDITRQQKVNLRLGGTFAATPTADLRLDLLLLGEQSITLACDFKI